MDTDDRSPTPPLSRTSAEAHLFMDLTPCSCGSAAFERRSVVLTDGSELFAQYSGACAQCATEREFIFRLPQSLPPAQEALPRFGVGRSELLDPGEWYAVAQASASAVPAEPAEGVDEPTLRRLRRSIAIAQDALVQLQAFVGDDGTVPDDALRSRYSEQLRQQRPSMLTSDGIAATITAYEQIAERYDSAPSSDSV